MVFKISHTYDIIAQDNCEIKKKYPVGFATAATETFEQPPFIRFHIALKVLDFWGVASNCHAWIRDSIVQKYLVYIAQNGAKIHVHPFFRKICGKFFQLSSLYGSLYKLFAANQ